MRTTYDWIGSRLKAVLHLHMNWGDGLARLSPILTKILANLDLKFNQIILQFSSTQNANFGVNI